MRFLDDLKRACREEDGAATLEFVIVFPFFIAIVLSMFESGWLMTKYMMLDRGVDMAMRDLKLGNLGTSPTEEELKARICGYSEIFSNCTEELFLELRDITDPALDASFPHGQADCYDRSPDVDVQPKMEIDNSGQREQIVFVRACLLIDPVLPGIGLGAWLPQADSGGHQMVSSGVFMNEPQ